jgi:hypothetical protein
LQRIASYDNYYGSTPHRLVEFEFENIEAATKYWDRPEIQEVLEELVNQGVNIEVQVFKQRGDYTKG